MLLLFGFVNEWSFFFFFLVETQAFGKSSITLGEQMSNISSQHGPLLKQNRDTELVRHLHSFSPWKGTSLWAQSYQVIPQAVLPAFWLLPWHISQHTYLCLNAQKSLTTPLHWSYYSTTIFLFNFLVCQPKVKEQIIPFIIRWKRKLFWGKNFHWWSFPLKSLIPHQCEGSRYYKKRPQNKTEFHLKYSEGPDVKGTERH